MNKKEQGKILILGLGNVLLGDEGIGVKLIQELDKESLPENVDLLDGGTGGFYILSVLEAYDTIIMIDATIDEAKPGTINVLEPKYASDFPRALSSHDIGLKDLIESAILLGHLPKIYLITVTISQDQDIRLKLSPYIENAIPKVKNKVLEMLQIVSRK